MNALHIPILTRRFVPVWRRNFLVWKKLGLASVLGNIADPMIALVAFGYGLGSLLPNVDGVRYVQYLAAGTICMSTMYAASFEALYSAFSRMHVQRTWDGIMNAPVALDDVLYGELSWAATKAMMSGVAIMLVVTLLGLTQDARALLILPVVLLAGLAFAAIGLVINALARSYDFFTFYFTLVITPMGFLSGVFFPLAQLPSWLQMIAFALPLTHAVELTRPLLLGAWPSNALVHISVLLAYALIGMVIAATLTRKRLLT
jgi:lipooligosaccharide transport system permease protein